ncbi:MAG TPA: hypothetical protein VHV57_04010 [Acidimicrobiales bacterium]|jgi:hypothetical protein|nr:hypothetical protein [Acidimicrobiales bacterium]
MIRTTDKLYIYLGLAGVVIFFIGLLIAGVIPPPSPSEGGGQIHSFLHNHTGGIRWGSIVAMFGITLLAPWMAVLSKLFSRIEGPSSPAAYCQMAMGALLIISVILPFMMLEVAVFRPDRPQAVTLALSDVCWILLLGIVYDYLIELFVSAAIIFRDKREHPVFPRWVAYFNILIAAMSAPDIFIVTTRKGPFAWNGLAGFWVAAVAFGGWVIAMSVVMIRATNRQEDEPTDLSELERLSAEVAQLRQEVQRAGPLPSVSV